MANLRGTIRDPATTPRCCDPLFGYGIGRCAGCERFPTVLYRKADTFRWRCEACYKTENGGQVPNNLVKR